VLCCVIFEQFDWPLFREFFLIISHCDTNLALPEFI